MWKVLQILLILFFGCSSCNPNSSAIVDYHVHIFSPELIENIEKQGLDFKKSGFQVIKPVEDYSNMGKISKDNNHAKMLLISVGYAYKNLDGEITEEAFVKRENDLLAKMVGSNPDNLIGFYGVDPLKSFSYKEIIRCDEELKLHGLKLHLQSNNLDMRDSIQLRKLREVFQLADERNIPILIHNNAWDNDFGKTYFKIFKEEILEKCESLTIIFAHGGGGGGFYKFGYDFLSEFNNFFKDGGNKMNHKIYFELSGVVKPNKYPDEMSTNEFLKLMEQIGYERFLFGSDYPVRNTPTYLKELSDLLNLETGELRKISERDIFRDLK